MQFNSYFLRALKTADKRYARVFEKMGYGKSKSEVEPEKVEEPEIEVVAEEIVEAAEDVANERDEEVETSDEASPKRRGRKAKA